jgi:gas vesicle protein
VAKNSKSTSGSGFFWGLMLGLIAGALLAILYAPQSGEETREQLSEQGIELRRRGMEGYQQFATQVRERYSDAFEQGREAYGRTKDEVLSNYSKGKSAP